MYKNLLLCSKNWGIREPFSWNWGVRPNPSNPPNATTVSLSSCSCKIIVYVFGYRIVVCYSFFKKIQLSYFRTIINSSWITLRIIVSFKYLFVEVLGYIIMSARLFLWQLGYLKLQNLLFIRPYGSIPSLLYPAKK